MAKEEIKETVKDAAKPETEKVLLTWTAPEFMQHERTWKWYLGAASVLAIICSYSIFTRDWFVLPVAIIVFGVMLYAQKEKPKEVKYKITQLGFYIDDNFFPYNRLHSFWLVVEDNLRILNLIFVKKYLPQRTILFDGIDPVSLREVLTKYLPEQEDRTENLIEKLSRKLKI